MENQFTAQEIYKWFAKQRFQREQGEQEYTMIYEIDLPKIINQFIKDYSLTKFDERGPNYELETK
jgi:hypothetical protein